MNKTMYCLALAVTMAALFLFNDLLSASLMDDSIETSAKQSYVYKTYLKGDDIKIHSHDGVVVLTGNVSREFHKSLAGETVSILPGVKSVDNKLEVKGEVHAIHSDEGLIARVKSIFLLHRKVNAANTEIFAKDGIITLRGEAASAAQKKRTTEFAKDVEGVKSVINEMTVLTAAAIQGKKAAGKKMDAIGEPIDDASITAMVKTMLQYHRSTSALNASVETKKGVVRLMGKVKNPVEKYHATKLVRDVHGVKIVVNKITFKGDKSKPKFH